MIRVCKAIEILENQEILDEYGDECHIDGLPNPSAKKDMYLEMERSGALHTIGAFLENTVIGFVTVLAPIVPHYGVLVAVTESFFVAKEHRKTGAGLRLLRAAEQYAKERGSPGLLISAPFGGSLAEVLSRMDDYVETNRVFFRKF